MLAAAAFAVSIVSLVIATACLIDCRRSYLHVKRRVAEVRALNDETARRIAAMRPHRAGR